MSGLVNESGKVLGAATAVSGSTAILSQGPLKTLAVVVLIVAICGAMLVVFSSTIRRLIVRRAK
jgi:hypothetical protein